MDSEMINSNSEGAGAGTETGTLVDIMQGDSLDSGSTAVDMDIVNAEDEVQHLDPEPSPVAKQAMDSVMINSNSEEGTETLGETMQGESLDSGSIAVDMDIVNAEDEVQQVDPEASIDEEIPSASLEIVEIGMAPSAKKLNLDNGCPENSPTSSSIQQLSLIKVPKVNLGALFKACQPKRKPNVRRRRKVVKVPARRGQRKSCPSPDITTPQKSKKPGKYSAQQSTSTYEDFKVELMTTLEDMRSKRRACMTVASFTARGSRLASKIGYNFKTLPEDWIQDLQKQYSKEFSDLGINHLAMAAPLTERESRKKK